MTRLLNDRVAYKTFDDRACVTSMILAMEELQNYDLPCTVRVLRHRPGGGRLLRRHDRGLRQRAGHGRGL